METFTSERLGFERLSAVTQSALQQLARDRYIARYLLDGETVPEGWARAEPLQ